MSGTNEGRIVKALEIIAECMVKSNKMAEEALKQNLILFKASKAIESQYNDYVNGKP